MATNPDTNVPTAPAVEAVKGRSSDTTPVSLMCQTLIASGEVHRNQSPLVKIQVLADSDTLVDRPTEHQTVTEPPQTSLCEEPEVVLTDQQHPQQSVRPALRVSASDDPDTAAPDIAQNPLGLVRLQQPIELSGITDHTDASMDQGIGSPDPEVLCESLLSLSELDFFHLLMAQPDVPLEFDQPAGASAAAEHTAVAPVQPMRRRPQCPNQHYCTPTNRIDELYPHGLYQCDQCAVEKHDMRWHCSDCLADICFSCTFTPLETDEHRDSMPREQQQNISLRRRSAPTRLTTRSSDRSARSAKWNGTNSMRTANDDSPKSDRNSEFKNGQGEQAQFRRVRSYNQNDDDCEDEWEGHRIVMKRGKYQGRGAFVKSRANMKYRVMVDGVEDQLEFYPTSFAHAGELIDESMMVSILSAPAI